MRFTFLIITFFLIQQSFAQQKWNLKNCIEYAMKNNYNVSQSEIQAKISALTYKQSKVSQIPNASVGTNTAFNSGSNQDPTTFSRVTENYWSAGMQLQSSAEIFNFFSKKNTIASNQWELMAAVANVNKIKNDIALSTANAYLQILLALQQENITAVQIQQTQSQLSITNKMVDAGTLPPLNSTQLEAQLANDSSNYISAKGNTTQAILALKSLMNIDAALPFEIEAPSVDSIPLESIADLQPEYVYEQALKNQPQQLGDEFRLKAANKMKLASKASMYPSISAFGNFSSSYLYFSPKPIYNKIFNGYQSTGLIATDGSGVVYDVQSPEFTNGDVFSYFKAKSLSAQFSDNLRKSLGISISVPLFNGSNAKTMYEKSRLNVQSIEIQKAQNSQKLKQDIYQAYNAALVALQKYNASNKSVEANTKAYDFAMKRFNIGALSTFDLITTQNNLLRAKLENTLNHFDYVFKMKVIEFYKGVGLKL